MPRKEDFPITERLVDEFIIENKKQWNQVQYKDGFTFVNFSMVRMQSAWIIPKLVYAKGIEAATGTKVIVITWRKNELLTKFIESFGMKHISLDSLMKVDIKALFSAIGKTLKYFVIDGTGDALKEMKAVGINVGKPIYEDIVRTSSLSTIKSGRNVICVKKLFHLLWMTYSLNNYICNNKPFYCVSDDIAYHEGLIIKMFKNKGAQVVATNYDKERYLELEQNGDVVRMSSFLNEKCHMQLSKMEQADTYAQWTDKYLAEKFQGKNGREIDRIAFEGKKVIGRNEIKQFFSFSENKKIIVIMAHTFTDAVFNYGDLFFRDYYDWLEQTLKIAANIDNVYWILKPHPARGAYNESEDSIEKLFEKYKKDHMGLLPDDVSAESIINFADAQVTIGGNSGAEFSCFGIPTVIVGKPYYSGFGYTIEPKTKDEYVKVLSKMDVIKPLSLEQTKVAKEVYYVRNNCNVDGLFMYSDDFSNIVNSEYKRMTGEMKAKYHISNDGTKSYNDEALSQIIDFMKKNQFSDTQYYNRGRLLTENGKC